MLEKYFQCPHCWQEQLKLVDPSIRNQNFIEDCEICCNPNKIQYTLIEGILTIYEISNGNE